jgi:ABC-type glycerol-3-phosphate transport system permease component
VIIWQFTQAWNKFLFAVILTNQSNCPVTVALNNLAGSQLVQWNVLMAATFLAALPTLLVYVFLGRFLPTWANSWRAQGLDLTFTLQIDPFWVFLFDFSFHPV